jgi:hypothetical protein
MIILDRLLIGGLAFVLDKLAVAADREIDDKTTLREQLLDAQMKVELGEMSDMEYRHIEQQVVRRLRELHEEGAGQTDARKVQGVSVEATFGDE